MPTPVLGGQRQPNQRADRPFGAQHRVGELEQRIRPQTQAAIERTTKRVKIIQARRARLLASATRLLHTGTHGHRLRLRALWKEPEDDQTVAASCHGDTPSRGDKPDIKRLNDKLRGAAPDTRKNRLPVCPRPPRLATRQPPTVPSWSRY
jgi:hypothetical protein